MAEKVCVTEALIDEESPEEGEIQDDSSDEESCETTTSSRRSKYYGVVKEKYETPASTSVEVRRSARLRKSGGRDPHPDNTTISTRIGYPVCVQDVYKNYDNYQPVIDNRNEKENKISRQPRRLHRVSPLPDYAPKALEQRHDSVKMSNRSHSEHRKQRRRASQDKKKKYSKKKKSDVVGGKNDDIVVLSDSSDIEVQIQKTKKRLKHDNFQLEHLKGPKATPSTVNTVTSLDTLDLNKSSSSLEILEVKGKAPPPVIEIIETDSHINTKINIGVINTEDKKEELLLRADALKSVLAGKYLNKKKKDNAPVCEDGEVNSQEDGTSPVTSTVQTCNEPVDMEISLTDDENESSAINTIASVVQRSDLQQESLPQGAMCQKSCEVADQLVVVDEVGGSPTRSQGAHEPLVGLEEEDEQLLRAQLLIAISSKETPIPVKAIVQVKEKANGSKSSVQIIQVPLQLGKQIPQKLKALSASRPVSTKSNPYRFNKNAKKLIYSTKRVRKLPGKTVKLLLKKYHRPTVPSNLPGGGDQQKMSVPYLDEKTTKPISSPIPPTSGRIVIRLGEDTDTDDELEAPPIPKPETPKIVPQADLMKSVDEFLKQVRQNVEQNQKPQPLPSETEVLVDQVAVQSATTEPQELNSDSPLSDLVSKCSPKPTRNSNTNSKEQPEPEDISVHSVSEETPSDEIPLSSFKAVIKSSNNSPSSPAQGLGKKKNSTPSLTAEKTVRTPKTRITSKKSPLLPTPKTPLLSTPKIPSLLSSPIVMKTVSTKQGSTKITFNTTDEPSSGIVAPKVSTPQVLRHLTSSQQMEYKRLKLEIARREELMKLKARLGQPVSKSNNKREDQPKLEITVRNSAGGEADTSFRTVRQTEIETEERTVSINQNQTSETSINDTVRQAEVDGEERTVFLTEPQTSAGSVIDDTEISTEKNDSLPDKSSVIVEESSVEIRETNEEAIKLKVSEVATDIQEQEPQPPTTEEQNKKTESPLEMGIGKRSAPVNVKSIEPKKKRQRLAPRKKMSSTMLLKLPEEEKKMKLNSTELELFSKRQEMLTQLTQLAALLTDMERGQAQTTDAEARVEALKRELARAELRAEEQRTAVKKLFTQVGQLRIEVAQTRMHCSGLSQTCQILGQSTQGSDYYVPQEGAELLKIHLQQVVELTKKTKQIIHPIRQSSPSLSSTFPNTESKVVSSSNIPSNLHSTKSEDDTSSNGIKQVLVESQTGAVLKESLSAPESTVSLPAVVLKTTDKPDPKSPSPSSVEEPKIQTYLRVKPLKSLMDLECSDPLKETKLYEHFTGLLPDLSPLSTSLSLPPSCPSLRPYSSPLEHMKPKIRLHHQQDDTMDPNKIMCPFALSGICLDDECSFQHPRPSSTL